MEHDILSKLHIPPRPTEGRAYKPEAMSKAYRGSNARITKMVKLMKAFKPSSKSPVGSWSLDARCHSDWKDPDPLKNRNKNRDFYKWAAGAFIEELLVSQYRSSLLSSSDAAVFLRKGLITAFQPFVQPHSIPRNDKFVKVTTFCFPDLIKCRIEVPSITNDIDNVIDNNDKVIYLNKARTSIDSLHRSIQKNPFAKRTIAASSDIDPDVSIASKALYRVRPSFSILHIIQSLPLHRVDRTS
jgi:hypothetical protein